jgi:CDK-activating kinase assembly factor MAT1
LDDYVDGRSGVLFVKEDKGGVVRGGGFDLKGFWEMEIRAGLEGLGVRPMA